MEIGTTKRARRTNKKETKRELCILQFYNQPPTDIISLQEFEECAIERLRGLSVSFIIMILIGCQRFRPFSDLTPRGFGPFPFRPWRFRPPDIKMSDFCQSLFCYYSFYPCFPIISDRSPGLRR